MRTGRVALQRHRERLGLLLGAVYAIALGGVALHGLVLWDDPLQRACAFAVTALAIVMTAGMARDGAAAP